ncbi:MAG: hypothetical protein ABFR95_04670 [Actinomycetota bacterium]
MSNRFEELVTSPYDDEPGGIPPWMKWVMLVGIGVVLVGFGLVVLLGGDDDPEAQASPTSTIASIPGEGNPVEGEFGEDPPSEQVTDPDDGLGPEPAFDTRGFGGEQELEFAEPSSNLSFILDTTMEHSLNQAETVALGKISDPDRIIIKATGLLASPYDDSFGGPGECFGLATLDGTSMDCHPVTPDASLRPLFSGFVGYNLMAWGGLPEEASVAVLMVDDQPEGWQRPKHGVVVFRAYVVTGRDVEVVIYDAEGTEIARADRRRPPESDTLYVEPITGFADYTEVSFEEIDFTEATGYLVACMRDNNFEVDVPPVYGPGLGFIDLSIFSEENLPFANETLARCRLGLNLPERPRFTPEALEDTFTWLTDLYTCLTDDGYEIMPPPEFEAWLEQPIDIRWDPMLILMEIDETQAQVALQKCDG